MNTSLTDVCFRVSKENMYNMYLYGLSNRTAICLNYFVQFGLTTKLHCTIGQVKLSRERERGRGRQKYM